MLYIGFILLHGEMIDYGYCSRRAVVLNRFLSYPVFVIVLLLIWKVSTMDPGRVFPGTRFRREFRGAESDPGTQNLAQRSCDVCDIEFPEHRDIKHCRECGYCVEGFDHHCGVIGTCIGKRNRLYFVFILGLGAVGHTLAAVVTYCRVEYIDSTFSNLLEATVSLNYDRFIQILWPLICDNFFFLYYCYVGIALIGFFLLHVLLLSYKTTTRRFLKSDLLGYAQSAMESALLGWCKYACGDRLARVAAWAHQHLDFRRGAVIPPRIRWKIIAVFFSGSYIYLSIYRMLQATSVSVALWYLCTFLISGYATMLMRDVVLSGQLRIDKSDFIDDAEITTDNESVNLLETAVPKGAFFCDVCDWHWSRQDHHCGLFGTCIHKGNRDKYIKCIQLGILGTSMFIYPSYSRVYENWVWDCPASGAVNALRRCIVKLLLSTGVDMLMLYASTGLFLCGIVFYVQQILYVKIERGIRKEFLDGTNVDFLANRDRLNDPIISCAAVGCFTLFI